MLFAYRSLTPARWLAPDKREGLDLYASDSSRGGWILETSPLTPFAGGTPDTEFTRFADALVTRTHFDVHLDTSPPRGTFPSLTGYCLDFTWTIPAAPCASECLVDGRAIDYSLFPRLEPSPLPRHRLQNKPVPSRNIL